MSSICGYYWMTLNVNLLWIVAKIVQINIIVRTELDLLRYFLHMETPLNIFFQLFRDPSNLPRGSNLIGILPVHVYLYCTPLQYWYFKSVSTDTPVLYVQYSIIILFFVIGVTQHKQYLVREELLSARLLVASLLCE